MYRVKKEFNLKGFIFSEVFLSFSFIRRTRAACPKFGILELLHTEFVAVVGMQKKYNSKTEDILNLTVY